MGVRIDVRGWTTVRRAAAAARRVVRACRHPLTSVTRMVQRRDRADPHRPSARELYRSGRVLDRAGHRSAAIEAYRAAIDRDPTRPTWHFRLGRALERQRHWTDAAAAYRAAIDLDPTRPHWHAALGRMLERMRDAGAAARAYERALALDDSHPHWHQRHAAALRRAHDREGLRRAVDAMIAREPDMSAAERRLLSADPARFDVRRRVLRFVSERLDEIRDGAAMQLPPSQHPPDRVWVYWGQGIADAPGVVQRCHAEVLRLHEEGRVVVLDDSTVQHHSELPGYVHDRTRDDRTKYSDVLRLDLLTRHGGVWLDATCLPREDLAHLRPQLVLSGFFALRFRRARISSWMLAGTPGNPTMARLRAAQVVYWRHHDRPIDYFMLHHLFEALFHVDPETRATVQAMPRISAHASSRFARSMLEPYEPQRFRELLDGAFVHKLSYKAARGRDVRGTMLEHLLEHGVPERTR